MSERKIDRAAWADQVNLLILTISRGNRAAFARLVGIDYGTIGRWQRQAVDVREESVREVARAIGMSPFDLLVKVGYYRADEATPTEMSVRAETPDERELRIIRESNISPELKAHLIETFRKRQDQDRLRRAEELRMIVRAAGGDLPADEGDDA